LDVKQLNLSEVRKDLPGLVDEVIETKEDIVITRRGKPVAKIVPFSEDDVNRYPLRGLGVWMSDDFNEPMTELWEAMTRK
jgi:prevent-host-death family protein